MYIETKEKFIYYRYTNKSINSLLYGKIYKIIDFGRADIQI